MNESLHSFQRKLIEYYEEFGKGQQYVVIDLDFLDRVNNAYMKRVKAERHCYSDATNIILQERLKVFRAYRSGKKKNREKDFYLSTYYNYLCKLQRNVSNSPLSTRLRNMCYPSSDFVQTIAYNVIMLEDGSYAVKCNVYKIWCELVNDYVFELDPDKASHTRSVIREIMHTREQLFGESKLITWELSREVINLSDSKEWYYSLPREL